MTDWHEWTEDELAQLRARELQHYPLGLDSANRVQLWFGPSGPDLVVKSLDNSSPELTVLRTLLARPAPGNRTVPTELIACDATTLAIMPALNRTTGYAIWPDLDRILQFAHDLLQGIDFMHSLGIAHCDVHPDNVVQAVPTAEYGPSVEAGRIYIIDFGISRFVPAKAALSAVEATEMQGHYTPPEGRDAAEPFSYDVYCVGSAIKAVCRDTAHNLSRANRVPLSLWAFTKALTAANPARRPSIRHARKIFALLYRWLRLTRWVHWFLPIPQADRIDLYGWYFFCRLVLSAAKRGGHSRP